MPVGKGNPQIFLATTEKIDKKPRFACLLGKIAPGKVMNINTRIVRPFLLTHIFATVYINDSIIESL